MNVQIYNSGEFFEGRPVSAGHERTAKVDNFILFAVQCSNVQQLLSALKNLINHQFLN